MPSSKLAGPRPLTIDTHAHVFLPRVLGACGPAGPELTIERGVQTFRAGSYTIQHVRFQNSPMSNPEMRLALINRMGIDVQVLSPYPMLYFYDQPQSTAATFCRIHNDEMARLVRRFPANSRAWRHCRCKRRTWHIKSCVEPSKSSA